MLAELRGAALLRGARGPAARRRRRAWRTRWRGSRRWPRRIASDCARSTSTRVLVLEEGRGVVAVDWLIELA